MSTAPASKSTQSVSPSKLPEKSNAPLPLESDKKISQTALETLQVVPRASFSRQFQARTENKNSETLRYIFEQPDSLERVFTILHFARKDPTILPEVSRRGFNLQQTGSSYLVKIQNQQTRLSSKIIPPQLKEDIHLAIQNLKSASLSQETVSGKKTSVHEEPSEEAPSDLKEASEEDILHAVEGAKKHIATIEKEIGLLDEPEASKKIAVTTPSRSKEAFSPEEALQKKLLASMIGSQAKENKKIREKGREEREQTAQEIREMENQARAEEKDLEKAEEKHEKSREKNAQFDERYEEKMRRKDLSSP